MHLHYNQIPIIIQVWRSIPVYWELYSIKHYCSWPVQICGVLGVFLFPILLITHDNDWNIEIECRWINTILPMLIKEKMLFLAIKCNCFFCWYLVVTQLSMYSWCLVFRYDSTVQNQWLGLKFIRNASLDLCTMLWFHNFIHAKCIKF